MPDIHEVVETIARSNGETIQIHGAEAARRFGLTTQVPTAPLFHTSASSRTIRIGGVTVRMVHTSNRRRLQCAGEPTGAALSALWYLGKDNVTPETIARIEAALGPTEPVTGQEIESRLLIQTLSNRTIKLRSKPVVRT